MVKLNVTKTHYKNGLKAFWSELTMSEEDSSSVENYLDDDDDADVCHLERWAPLGANASSSPPIASTESSQISELERLRKLEEEQEQLNMSLLSLTTHFAQVQFRLRQIVDAPNDEKEVLLKELEEFAFKGIPDITCCSDLKRKKCPDDDDCDKEHDELMEKQRQKQLELISQLKSQLEDLETYAYETGEPMMPTSRVLEKQKVVIDQLVKKLSLKDLEHLDKLSSEELRETVDRAIGQILYPGKVKEKLVDQLKTQITDLERFIEFLQGEQNGDNSDQCSCKVHGQQSFMSGHANKNSRTPKQMDKKSLDKKNLREQTISLIRHAATVLQIFAITQFGCGNQKDFQRNLLKRTARGNHWGDLRARLEIAISRVVDLSRNSSAKENVPTRKYSTNSYDEAWHEDYNMEIVNAVRKDLAMSLKDLLQHGLMELEPTQSLVPFGCLSNRNKDKNNQSKSMMHAWQLFLKYYQVKHGKAYSEAPARRLSVAFGLEMVGGKAMTPKQTLLTAIEEVSSTHQPLKRNDDSQFKAFICMALNQKRLVSWLRIILRTEWLVEYYYQPWSYVMKTGFDDALVSLDSLTKVEFDLPTDLAIRPFQNIRDAF